MQRASGTQLRRPESLEQWLLQDGREQATRTWPEAPCLSLTVVVAS